MTYTPSLERQLRSGSRCPGKDCAPSAAVTAAKRASVGRFDLEVSTVRAASGVGCYEGTGGIPYSTLSRVIADLTHDAVILTNRAGEAADLRDYVKGGRFAVVSIDYSEILGRRCACEDDFGGGHAICVCKFRVYNGVAQYLYGDPLCDGRGSYPNGWQWVNASVVHRAGYARTQGDHINFTTTRDTEGTTRLVRLDGVAVHSKPYKGATIVDRLDKGMTVFVERTVNGGQWIRDTDGGVSKGWHYATGPGFHDGYVKGEGLR